MTPADGSDFAAPPTAQGTLTETQVILLQGGRVLLLFEGADAPPPITGTLGGDGKRQTWTAECWRHEVNDIERWCGLAVLDTLPPPHARLRDAADAREWCLNPPSHIDVAPQPLADLVRRSGVDCCAVFRFLVTHLLTGRTDSPETRAHHAFATAFFTAAAERDGFIEVLALPESGGLFAQGWSLSLTAGSATLASVAEDLAVREVEVALFEREDILAPGRGFCIFGKHWRDADPGTIDAVFFEKDGRLLRLDVVHGSMLTLTGTAATAHVVEMLPRIEAPDTILRAFRRVCRPCFAGADTLTGTDLPIAAAFDTLLRAPDGTLLVTGWMLDPLRRVDRVMLKSNQALYADLNIRWCPLPRADLNRAFGADPRFAGLLDEHDAMHGFIAHAPARRTQIDEAQVYLEIVLDDNTCLFRPVAVTPFDSAERLPQVLAALSPADPEFDRVIEEHLAPFLASVRPTATPPRRGGAARPIPLGEPGPARDIAALIPFATFAELQPIFGLLAGAPEAKALDLILVTSRAIASETLRKIADAFVFFGLHGQLVISSDHQTRACRLDTGIAATEASTLLCWMPNALPKAPGWLGRLMGEAQALPRPGILSPALTYEDGSIYFGGERSGSLAPTGACARAGMAADRLHRGAALQITAAAPEIALIGREPLERAGGFAGNLFSDAFTHLDLAARLARNGGAAYCSGCVEFWLLDDARDEQSTPTTLLMQKVDAALLARRAHSQSGDAAR